MAELRPYEPTWRDRMASLMMGDGRASPERRRFVEGLLGSSGLGNTGMGVVDVTPIGGLLGAQEAAQQGDVRGAALAVLPVPGSAKTAFRVVKGEPKPATYIHPNSFMHSYSEPTSGAYMNIVTRPDAQRSASVIDLYVPEEFRGQGIGKLLQSEVLNDFPSLQGQVSSKAAASNAYKAGRRLAGNESATLDDILKKIEEESSVNLWTVP